MKKIKPEGVILPKGIFFFFIEVALVYNVM